MPLWACCPNLHGVANLAGLIPLPHTLRACGHRRAFKGTARHGSAWRVMYAGVMMHVHGSAVHDQCMQACPKPVHACRVCMLEAHGMAGHRVLQVWHALCTVTRYVLTADVPDRVRGEPWVRKGVHLPPQPGKRSTGWLPKSTPSAAGQKGLHALHTLPQTAHACAQSFGTYTGHMVMRGKVHASCMCRQ